MFGKLTNLSRLPGSALQDAARRARLANKTVCKITEDLYHAQASNSFRKPSSPLATQGRDFYAVRFFESDGELLVSCECAFGTKGEDIDKICRHVADALMLRNPAGDIPKPKPAFVSGKIDITFDGNNMVVSSYTKDSAGRECHQPFITKRLQHGTGDRVMRLLLEDLRK